MSDPSRRRAIRNLIGAALATVSPLSLIHAAIAQGREVTVKTTDGREIRIKTHGSEPSTSEKDSSVAQIVAAGKVVDPTPSGTFMLAGGKSITLDKGRLVGGSAARQRGRWALFALISEPPQRSR